MKKQHIGIIGSVVLVGAIGYGVMAPRVYTATIAKKQSTFSSAKVNALNQLLGKNYIGEVTDEALVEGIYKGYVAGLEDSGTAYLTKEEFEQYQVASEGNYLGVGLDVVWGITSQYLVVSEVIPDSPAAAEGIQVGDRIEMIDGIKAMMSNQIEIYEKLLGGGDQAITYDVVAIADGEKRRVSLTPQVVALAPYEAQKWENGIGYIQLKSMKKGLVDQLSNQLATWEQEGTRKVVLDLRDCYTDQLEEVVLLCDLFLEEELLFQTTSKKETKEHMGMPGSVQTEVVLVVNSGTAGLLEAFVSALQCAGRAQVVGTTTAGGATMQELVALADGSGLSITAGYVQNRDGVSLQGHGVDPDVVVKLSTENSIERITTGSLSPLRDEQIQAAISLLK